MRLKNSVKKPDMQAHKWRNKQMERRRERVRQADKVDRKRRTSQICVEIRDADAIHSMWIVCDPSMPIDTGKWTDKKDF